MPFKNVEVDHLEFYLAQKIYLQISFCKGEIVTSTEKSYVREQGPGGI
jgi:hypothetical protein